MNLKEMRREFKKDLEKSFGKGNVSVKGDTGTARSWTLVKIKQTVLDYDTMLEEAHEIEAKYDWPTYLVDDGYNDNYSTCVLIQIEKGGE